MLTDIHVLNGVENDQKFVHFIFKWFPEGLTIVDM